VDFFFVLSGFVIAYAYGERLRDVEDIRGFTLRRFARLWPLHVTVLAAFLLLEFYRFAATSAGFTGERSVFAIFTNLALVQSLGVHEGLTWNTPAWSISTEFYTYLVFAGVCVIAPARRYLAAAALMLLGFAMLFFFSRYGMRETFCFGFFRCLYGFFAGVLTFASWKSLPKKIGGTPTEIAALALVGLFVSFAPRVRALEYLAVPVFALAVFAFAQQAGAVSRAMESRIANALGRWSYSIYMVHMLVLACLFSSLDTASNSWTAIDAAGNETIVLASAWSGDLFAFFYLAIVIALAAFAFRLVELTVRSTARISCIQCWA
jgi:peptidoglycan/LPS O-acetylase OafA/YrhL